MNLSTVDGLTNVTDFTGLLTFSNNQTSGLLSIVILLMVFIAVIVVLKNSKVSIGAGGLAGLVLSWILQSLGELSGTVTVVFMMITIIGLIYASLTK